MWCKYAADTRHHQEGRLKDLKNPAAVDGVVCCFQQGAVWDSHPFGQLELLTAQCKDLVQGKHRSLTGWCISFSGIAMEITSIHGPLIHNSVLTETIIAIMTPQGRFTPVKNALHYKAPHLS